MTMISRPTYFWDVQVATFAKPDYVMGGPVTSRLIASRHICSSFVLILHLSVPNSKREN